jgi:hypothetical protein
VAVGKSNHGGKSKSREGQSGRVYGDKLHRTARLEFGVRVMDCVDGGG